MVILWALILPVAIPAAIVAPFSIPDVTTVPLWALKLFVAWFTASVAPFSISDVTTVPIWALKLLVACSTAMKTSFTAVARPWAFELFVPVFPAIVTLIFPPHVITTIIVWAFKLFVAYFAATVAPFSVHSTPGALVLFMAMLATLIAYGIHFFSS
jgi:hypothetical protein